MYSTNRLRPTYLTMLLAAAFIFALSFSPTPAMARPGDNCQRVALNRYSCVQAQPRLLYKAMSADQLVAYQQVTATTALTVPAPLTGTVAPALPLTPTLATTITLAASPNPTITDGLTGTLPAPLSTSAAGDAAPTAANSDAATGLPPAADTSIFPDGQLTGESNPALGTPGPGTEVPPTAFPAPAVTSSNDSGGGLLLPLILGGLALLIGAGVFLFLRRSPESEVAPTEKIVDTTVTTTEEAKVLPPVTTTAASSVVVSEEAATAVMPAVATPEQIACSNCGTLNPANERYCVQCGNPLEADKARLLASQTDATTATSSPTAAATADPIAVAAPPSATPLDLPDDQLPYLETVNRSDEQLEYVLDRSYITIGRARSNDIVIDNTFVGWQTVSLYHAELRYQNGRFVLVDKQSDNGSYVNRMRTGSNLLDDGVTISLGKVEFVYHQPGASS